MQPVIHLIIVFILIFNWGFAAWKSKDKKGSMGMKVFSLAVNVVLTFGLAYVIAWNSIIPIWVWWGLAALMSAAVALIVYRMLDHKSPTSSRNMDDTEAQTV